MPSNSLPNVERALVLERKIVDYLLSETHPDGRGKAQFFAGYGFRPAAWGVLAQALRRHARDHGVVETVETPFGTRYVVEGRLLAPDGRAPNMRTVWFIEIGMRDPNLVTAYPVKRR